MVNSLGNILLLRSVVKPNRQDVHGHFRRVLLHLLNPFDGKPKYFQEVLHSGEFTFEDPRAFQRMNVGYGYSTVLEFSSQNWRKREWGKSIPM